MDDNVVAVVAIVFIFGAPLLAWMVSRMLKHRERIEMIRAGMMPSGKMGAGAPYRSSATPERARGAEFDYTPAAAQAALRKAVVLTCVGVALLIGLSFIGFEDGPIWHPGPWLLGGLIPTFVGVAQILIALMSGASFSPYGTFQPPPPPQSFGPPPGVPGAAAPPTYDASYTYRPGSAQELRPPSPPPERRP